MALALALIWLQENWGYALVASPAVALVFLHLRHERRDQQVIGTPEPGPSEQAGGEPRRQKAESIRAGESIEAGGSIPAVFRGVRPLQPPSLSQPRFFPGHRLEDTVLVLTLNWQPTDLMLHDVSCVVIHPVGSMFAKECGFVMQGLPIRLRYPDDFGGAPPVQYGTYVVTWTGRSSSPIVVADILRQNVLCDYHFTIR